MGFRNRLKVWLKNRTGRGAEAKRIKMARRLDRESFAGRKPAEMPSYYTDSEIARHKETFGVDMRTVAGALLRTKPKVSVLDISAGQGTYLKEMKQRFGEKVRTVATGLARPGNLEGIDKYHVGRAENPKSGFSKGTEKFDMITCHAGETQFISAPALRKNVLSKLAEGGVAYLDFGAAPETLKNMIAKYIEKAG